MFHGKTTGMNRFVAGLFVAMALLFCSCMAKCPAKGEIVDADRFAGEWYVVSWVPSKHQPPSKCGHFEVTSSSNGVDINFDIITLEKNTAITYGFNATLDADFTGTWSQKNPDPRAIGTLNHRIIGSDYGSHLLMLGCSKSSNDVKFVAILSREKTLSENKLVSLKREAASYVDIDSICDVEQSC